MAGKFNDSLNKIKNYLEHLSVNEITISPLFFREYDCPAGCGGCCLKFSLIYLEGERWEKFKTLYPDKVKYFTERILENGTKVYEDLQKDNESFFCRNLDTQTGRCTVHEANPFSCEFELMKIFKKSDGKVLIINKLFGRGWNMKRIDGERGALCKMKGFSYEKFLRDLNLLKELFVISQQLNYDTILKELIEYLEEIKPLLKEGFVSGQKKIVKKPTNN
jgi:hypothetical protein